MNDYTKQFIKENIAEILFSIPKTIFFNFKVFIKFKCLLVKILLASI